MRKNYGSNFVALANEDAQSRFIAAVDAFFTGKMNAATLRETLFGIGVPADQIQRVLAGERLPTVSGRNDVSLTMH